MAANGTDKSDTRSAGPSLSLVSNSSGSNSSGSSYSSEITAADSPGNLSSYSTGQFADSSDQPLKRGAGSQLPVAVDAMGGDHGLAVQVEGALQAWREYGIKSLLVGPENDLRARLSALGGIDSPLEIIDAPEVVTMDESPVRAVRKKPNSSLCVAYEQVQQGRASSIISAGHSGAMMAAGRLLCGLLPGIERPAIATLIPVAGDGQPNVVLDSGANIDSHAQNLVQFAIMGSIYHTSLFGKKDPRVALLSNGTEPSKGTDIIRTASAIMSGLSVINYIGYVEARDVPKQVADVIVCDGFVGNVLLKAMEGCVRLIYDQLRHEARRSVFNWFGMALSRRLYKQVFLEKFDYTAYGGAPLLGLNQLALVLHGSSDARAVKNAIRVADNFARLEMIERIRKTLSQLEDSMPLLDEGDLVSVAIARGKNGKKVRGSNAVQSADE